MIRALPHIEAMAAYALSDLSAPPGVEVVSLSQNESFRPPSPLAVEAAARAMTQSAGYPDPDWRDLRMALGRHHGLDPAHILCGNGSLDLIGAIARVYAGPGRAILAPEHAYPYFRTASNLAQARFDTGAEVARTVSIDGLLQAVRADTSILFVANPGNPTGTRIAEDALRRLRAALRADILLVIDEAYGEYARDGSGTLFDLVDRGNTVILRTFSKAYGLAGARVGWGYFPPRIAAELRKALNPNNVSLASQEAARAALEDEAYMRETCRRTLHMAETASMALRAMGLEVTAGCTNFLLIAFAEAGIAARIDAGLRRDGIFLRAQGGVGLGHCLRMTIGMEAANTRALHRIGALMAEERA